MRRNFIMLVTTVVVIVGAFVATLLGSNRPVLGLDLQGGVSIVLFPVKGSDLSTLDTAVAIIRNRVDGLGIAEPDVSRQGGTIVVDLPGVKDRRRAEDLVGTTAELRFRAVAGTLPWSESPVVTTTTGPGGTTATSRGASTTTTSRGAGSSTTVTTGASSATTGDASRARAVDARPISLVRPAQAASTTAASTTTGPATTAPGGATSTTAVGGSTTTTAPRATVNTCEEGKRVTPRAADVATADPVILPDRDNVVCYVLGATLMTGRAISTAQAEFDPSQGGWLVRVQFRNDDFVTKVAQPYVNRNVAIVLDGVVQSAPTINPGITGRDVQITGQFTEREADNLALVLRYGSLPIQFDTTQQTSQSISPSLGKDQLRAGIVAGLIGLGFVALYMIVFYRLLGLVVWIGLGLTALTFFALVSWLSAHQGLTLTLAGVTGLIVSVGVTVDSYVVYFERLKDEVRTGKTVRSSLEPGFHRAFRTILAADLVSLLGAAILYLLAAGSVRGFAYFLGLSTVIDLALSYTFMHPFTVLLARRPALVRMRGTGVAAGLDVVGVRA